MEWWILQFQPEAHKKHKTTVLKKNKSLDFEHFLEA